MMTRILALWAYLVLCNGHSYLMEPPSRNALREGEICPHCLQAGGPATVEERAGGVWPSNSVPASHGLCGDPVQGRPVEADWRNEEYLEPSLEKRAYQAGEIVEFVIAVTAHHQGHYEFKLCDKTISGETLTSRQEGQDCLDARVLERAPIDPGCMPDDPNPDCQPIDPNFPGRWYLPPVGYQGGSYLTPTDTGLDFPYLPAEVHRMKYKIPEGFSCTACTLQWYWSTGNSCLYDYSYFDYFKDMEAAGWTTAGQWCPWCVTTWANCDTSCCGSGRGFGEEFWNCADVSVTVGGNPAPTPSPTPAPTGGSSTSQTSAQTPAPTSTSTAPEASGTCVRNQNCDENLWCNDATYDQWCAQQEEYDGSCPAPQCILSPGSTLPPSTQSTPAPTPAPAPAPTPASTLTSSTTVAKKIEGACVRNEDCEENLWCNDPSYDHWCAQQHAADGSCPSPQCILSGSNVQPTSSAAPSPASPSSSSSSFLGKTTTTTSRESSSLECVSQSVLQCINDASTYWPKCDPSQSKEVQGPAGYEYGHYCTQEWADALNNMLRDSAVGKCSDDEAVHKLLAQITYETAFFSTLYQPIDGGAGLIHMIPGNWEPNAADMDTLWPGNGYVELVQQMGKDFFQTPAYGWRSVAAWMKLTNGVIPTCGKDLFDESFDEQTRCILGQVVSRQEAFDIVGSCLTLA